MVRRPDLAPRGFPEGFENGFPGRLRHLSSSFGYEPTSGTTRGRSSRVALRPNRCSRSSRRTKAPRERLAEAIVVSFLRSAKRKTLPLRTALEAAERALDHPLDAVARLERAFGTWMDFTAEVAPQSPPARRVRVAEIVMTSMVAPSERLSRAPRSGPEVDTRAREGAGDAPDRVSCAPRYARAIDHAARGRRWARRASRSSTKAFHESRTSMKPTP